MRGDQCLPKHNHSWVRTNNPSRPGWYIFLGTPNNQISSTVQQKLPFGVRKIKLHSVAENNHSRSKISGQVSRQISVGAILRMMSGIVFFVWSSSNFLWWRVRNIRFTSSCDTFWETSTRHLSCMASAMIFFNQFSWSIFPYSGRLMLSGQKNESGPMLAETQPWLSSQEKPWMVYLFSDIKQ